MPPSSVKHDISLNAGISFFTAKEKITQLVGDIDDPLNEWFIGYPTRVSYDFNKIGIWQMADSALANCITRNPAISGWKTSVQKTRSSVP